MALNLKTLGTRSLSAAVFVILLIGSVLWNYYSFTAFFFIVAMIGLHEFYKIAGKLDAKPYKGIGFTGGVITYTAFIKDVHIANRLQILVLLVPFLVFAVAMFSKRERPVQNALFTIVGILYAVLPFAVLHHLWMDTVVVTLHPPWSMIIFMILLIWSNDTFAYLGGSLFGKHKMIERISPGKTWEGTIFGVLVTFGLSFIADNLLGIKGGWMTPVLGIVIPVLATVGDLVESMLKRQAGIKDSGNIMPGHGGVLDRFDSLIFVAPFVLAVMWLL